MENKTISRHCPLKSTQPSTEQTQSRSIFVNNFEGETAQMFEFFFIMLDIAY